MGEPFDRMITCEPARVACVHPQVIRLGTFKGERIILTRVASDQNLKPIGRDKLARFRTRRMSAAPQCSLADQIGGTCFIHHLVNFRTRLGIIQIV